jgi:hypothetical protein
MSIGGRVDGVASNEKSFAATRRRPRTSALVDEMGAANSLWGAPRIHGEWIEDVVRIRHLSAGVRMPVVVRGRPGRPDVERWSHRRRSHCRCQPTTVSVAQRSRPNAAKPERAGSLPD